MKALFAVFLCSLPAGASELGRLETMSSDPALIAPGYTGERAASGALVWGAASGARPSLTLSGAPSRRSEARVAGPRAPKKARGGLSFGQKLLILGAAMAFFAVAGLFIGAIVASVGYAFGAAWALQALGTGAGLGAGFGFAVGFPAAFQEQK